MYRLRVAKDLIAAYDTATLAGTLTDFVAASRLQDELDAPRATVRLLAGNNAERQLVADYVGGAVEALVGAAPALMPPAQLGDFCKRSCSSPDSVTPSTDGRCTPSSFIGFPRHTRELMVEWAQHIVVLVEVFEQALVDVCVMCVCVCLQALEVSPDVSEPRWHCTRL